MKNEWKNIEGDHQSENTKTSKKKFALYSLVSATLSISQSLHHRTRR
jgi:hypothetical protein